MGQFPRVVKCKTHRGAPSSQRGEKGGVMPKSSAEQQAYKNDPFAIESGHYVGHDGFVVPKDFEEFHQRFPDYVAKWVRRHADRFATNQDLEDWTNDLLIHLMRLPEDSKYRQVGKSDLVQTFDPIKQHGANAARFWNYINLCLTNKFSNMRSGRMKDALRQPGNLSFDAHTNSEKLHSVDDEYCYSHSEYLRKTETASEKRARHGELLQEFKNFVQREDAKALSAMDALFATGTHRDAAKSLGITQQDFDRMLRRLRQLRRCFLKGALVPRRRRPYKKRTSQTKQFTGRRLAA